MTTTVTKDELATQAVDNGQAVSNTTKYTGEFEGTFTGTLVGNATTAKQLEKPYNFTLSGDASGTVAVNASSVILETTVNQAKHADNADFAGKTNLAARSTLADHSNTAEFAYRCGKLSKLFVNITGACVGSGSATDSDTIDINIDNINVGELFVVGKLPDVLKADTSRIYVDIPNRHFWIYNNETSKWYDCFEQLETELDNHELRITDLEKLDLSNRVTSLETRATKVEQRATKLEERTTNAETELVNHESRITANETAKADHEKRITANETNISKHGERLTTAEKDISDLKGRATSLETRATTAENNITSLDARLTPTEETVSTFDSRITSAEKTVSDVSQRIDNIETTTDAGKYAAKLTELENKNTEQDTKLTELDTKLNEFSEFTVTDATSVDADSLTNGAGIVYKASDLITVSTDIDISTVSDLSIADSEPDSASVKEGTAVIYPSANSI